ncbi:serine/threonine-protein kinase [Actinomycetes bacterium M1A6_2h]
MTEQQRARAVVGPDYLLAGRYRLDSKLGGGGMGAVWLAVDTLLSRKVAVKQATSTADLTPEAAKTIREQAMREGRIAAQLANPHAIAMHDVALDSGEPWLIMEYLPSRSLAMALNITESLPPDEVIQIGAQVADALTAAHAAGIVHRDIKPGNILIADRGSGMGMVKISDFGISRAKNDTHEENSSVITGTPAYFAPEVARGADPTEASDVFSLGATLYTATEGQPPFGVDSDSIALLHKVAGARIAPPRRSGAMTATLLHMLEPDPARRPSMEQVRERLVTLAVGKNGSPSSVLNQPLRGADGTVPFWARRGARGGAGTTRRAERISGQTMTGLPAASERTPLDRVPRPGDTSDSTKPKTRYAAPAFEAPRKKSQTPVYVAIAVVAVILLIVLLFAL